ncbi:helix-turn-helix transcriptional regulator [Ideonella sp.]|uniref:helix-turn-helix transcriptional regulator n=1 Tax=Ideonella sp. TaxID=1929293 RepID=UPI0035B38912
MAGVGRVVLWPGGSLWIARQSGVAAPHAHHAIQLSLALRGRLAMADEFGRWCPYDGALVMPHHAHSFDGLGLDTATVFVEPETPLGRALLQRYGAQPITALPAEAVRTLSAPLRQGLEDGASDEALVAAARWAASWLVATTCARCAVDARIERSIAWLRARLPQPVCLAQAAARAHLSPSRFRHLFVHETGLSFRAYLLWARVESAVGAGMAGLSWTQAAHEAGFADSAHLSRTCRRMFGIAPAMLVRG